MAGKDWPERARTALVKLCQHGGDTVVSTGIQLLIDIKQIFDEGDDDKLSTSSVLNELVSIEGDRLWAAWWLDDLRHDKSQKPASRLAKLLKPYGIKARKIRIEDDTCQGYVRADFEEAWNRYLPYSQKGGTSGTSGTEPLGNSKNVPDVPDVPASRSDAHGLLVDLINRINIERGGGKDGLYPKGQPDCQWDEDYPAEYAAALDYLNGEHDEQGAFEALSSLVYKIDCEEKRGTPLQSQDRTWSSDDSPTEYHAAKGYMTEQMQRVERELLAS